MRATLCYGPVLVASPGKTGHWYLKDKFTPDKATLSAFLPAPSNDQPDVLSMVGKGERTANDPGT